MSRKRDIVRKYWFDGAIALLAIVGLIEFAIRAEPSSSPWFAVAAVGTLVFLIVARRRFPFAAPAAYWVVASAVSFADAVLLPSIQSLFVVGMATAFLLGNLRNGLKAAAGLAVVVGGAFVIVHQIPDHTNAELLFVPLEFAISWLAGFVLRERAEQAEAAEIRAAQAERERDAAARIAVAEERARIARELHDIVAHAVSVMVLQVGAVRHRLPEALEEDREALDDVERAGRTALAEMRRLLGAMRQEGDDVEFAPQPSLGTPRAAAGRGPPRGAPGAICTSRATRFRSLARSTSRPTGSSRKASRTPSSTRVPARRTSPSATRPPSSRSRSATTAAGRRRTTASATGSSASASASRSTEAR